MGRNNAIVYPIQYGLSRPLREGVGRNPSGPKATIRPLPRRPLREGVGRNDITGIDVKEDISRPPCEGVGRNP